MSVDLLVWAIMLAAWVGVFVGMMKEDLPREGRLFYTAVSVTGLLLCIFYFEEKYGPIENYEDARWWYILPM